MGLDFGRGKEKRSLENFKNLREAMSNKLNIYFPGFRSK